MTPRPDRNAHVATIVVFRSREIESSANEIENTNSVVEQQRDFTIINIAGTFTLLSCLVTMFHMTAHLRKMNQPFVQRKILAILWMVRCAFVARPGAL